MCSIDMESTGLRIGELRDACGLTNQDLADVLGFTSRNAIYRWLHGESLPTLDNLVILSELFHVGLDDIVVRQ